MINLNDIKHEKFVESYPVEGWSVKTDDGFKDIKTIHKTIPYKVWHLKTNKKELLCADNHIIFDKNMIEKYVHQFNVGDQIQTIDGLEEIIELRETDEKINMYDLQVNSFNQRYYTNGILSHNTATTALYILWYAMFKPDTNILIAAHKGTGATEIMTRIRYAYEECPDFIRCGTTTYTTTTIVFDNKSSITAQTTTENTGRGLSISLLYCLDPNTVVTVKDKETDEIKDISLENLYTELNGDELVEFKQKPMLRLIFEDHYYLDIPEDQTLIVNDIKTTIENIQAGDQVLINNDYYTLIDILAI